MMTIAIKSRDQICSHARSRHCLVLAKLIILFFRDKHSQLSAARRKSNCWLIISIVHYDLYLSAVFLRISHNCYRRYFRFYFHRSRDVRENVRGETIHGLDGIYHFRFYFYPKRLFTTLRILPYGMYASDLCFAIYYFLYQTETSRWEKSPKIEITSHY